MLSKVNKIRLITKEEKIDLLSHALIKDLLEIIHQLIIRKKEKEASSYQPCRLWSGVPVERECRQCLGQSSSGVIIDMTK